MYSKDIISLEKVRLCRRALQGGDFPIYSVKQFSRDYLDYFPTTPFPLVSSIFFSYYAFWQRTQCLQPAGWVITSDSLASLNGSLVWWTKTTLNFSPSKEKKKNIIKKQTNPKPPKPHKPRKETRSSSPPLQGEKKKTNNQKNNK